MNEQECLQKMIAPGQVRPSKPYRGGVIQIHVTRACDKQCFGCTQGSNLGGNPGMITLEQFEIAVKSLKDYWGVVGVFGGNPAMHPQFESLCNILASHIPYEQCGLWCNNPINESKAIAMRRTFNPAVSNLNVHLDRDAYSLFQRYWPESRPFGLHQDSRHSPVYVSMKDVGIPEDKRWELISQCDINQHWSAMIGVFRNEVRAWFCEIAGAMSILHQNDPDYPDTGIDIQRTFTFIEDPRNPLVPKRRVDWWQLPMQSFTEQVRKHCHSCGVPMRGYGELAQSTNSIECSTCQGKGSIPGEPNEKWITLQPCPTCEGKGTISPREQVSDSHQLIFKPKDRSRRVELVTVPGQLECGRIEKTTHYLQNSTK